MKALLTALRLLDLINVGLSDVLVVHVVDIESQVLLEVVALAVLHLA